MILGIEIALIVVGILALVRGKMTLSKTKVVVGAPARLLGVLALTPLPVAFLIVTLYAVSKNPANAERALEENRTTLMLIEAGVVIGIAVLVFGIGAAVAVTPEEAERRARGARYDDYEDGRYDDRDRDDRDRDQDDRYEDDDRRDRDDRRRPWGQ